MDIQDFDPIVTEADRKALAAGYVFDRQEADRPVRFIERFCRQSKGRWAGQPLALLDWQRAFIWRLYGWRRADGKRRFRRFYLEVAKKNGKSTMLSGLALYALLGDREQSAEVYINASDREQASIIYDEAARMVEKSPELDARLSVVKSKKRIINPGDGGKIVANSADVPNKDGVNASLVLFDELHRQRTRELWDIFEYAGASREQPLTGSITTAGDALNGIWHEQRDYSEKVNAGIIDDPTHLGVVYRADPGADLDDPETWRAANPSLGVTINEEDFAREFREAKTLPSKWGNFKRLRLNIVAGNESKFVDPEAWKACGAPAVIVPGRECYVGLDMSSRLDLTALAILFPDDAGGFDAWVKFWTPAARIEDKERQDAASYRAWAESGYINLCDGTEIDYSAVEETIKEVAADFDLKRFGADPWNCRQLMQRLFNNHGIPVLEVRQGFGSLSYPTKELERLVVAGKLRHGGNPVLSWCADNAIAKRDEAGNIKLDKKKSTGRIDGLAAIVNALAAYSARGDDATESVYKKRGLIILGK